jgi:hypothetical protein
MKLISYSYYLYVQAILRETNFLGIVYDSVSSYNV